MTLAHSKRWKGIILAGGAGTRLYPITAATSKQLLPIYDKPMVYYPLSTLMLGGIRDYLLISTPDDLPRFRNLLGDGSRCGIEISYAVQTAPRGIAEALVIGADFIGNSNVTLILGDNLFYGRMNFLRNALRRRKGATIFGYPVQNPERYGVIQMNRAGRPVDIIEKPVRPPSKYVVPGLYCYDNRAIDIARRLKPSARGELEITDVNRRYLAMGELHVELLGRGMAWLDTGTPHSLFDASHFVYSIENRQGLKIGCIEEVAFRMGFIDARQLLKLAAPLKGNAYGDYLCQIARESPH